MQSSPAAFIQMMKLCGLAAGIPRVLSFIPELAMVTIRVHCEPLNSDWSSKMGARCEIYMVLLLTTSYKAFSGWVPPVCYRRGEGLCQRPPPDCEQND